jgi:hypothetical protein
VNGKICGRKIDGRKMGRKLPGLFTGAQNHELTRMDTNRGDFNAKTPGTQRRKGTIRNDEAK